MLNMYNILVIINIQTAMGIEMGREKIVGILGGMGPEATADLFLKIIRSTPIKRDQDHIRVIIDSNSKIPDRIQAVYGNGESPFPQMLDSARLLASAGAEIILIACNGAHMFFGELRDALDSVLFLNIMDETAKHCLEKHHGVSKYGLLATDATIRGRLYEKSFNACGLRIEAPDQSNQAIVMDCIYKFKSGIPAEKLRAPLIDAGRSLLASGAEGIILGCTELPMIIREGDLPAPIVDPTMALALAAVNKSREG